MIKPISLLGKTGGGGGGGGGTTITANPSSYFGSALTTSVSVTVSGGGATNFGWTTKADNQSGSVGSTSGTVTVNNKPGGTQFLTINAKNAGGTTIASQQFGDYTKDSGG